jgi:pimeloyl-ACP methyl ester carboxylesterase
MDCQYLKRPGKKDIAYHYVQPKGAGKDLPHIFFLGGFKSDMNGTKALYLHKRCEERGQGFLRFDYTGHGQSGGDFTDGTIGAWKQDALDIFDHVGAERVILVGSSMGGWISLLVAREREASIYGLIGIAAAPDHASQGVLDHVDDRDKLVYTAGEASSILRVVYGMELLAGCSNA